MVCSGHLPPSGTCIFRQGKITYAATNISSSARINRLLISDSLLHCISAASVTHLVLTDRCKVSVSVLPANAPPERPELWSIPPVIISLPVFNTAQTKDFSCAKPVHTALSRAARWEQLKMHIQDAARGYFASDHESAFPSPPETAAVADGLRAQRTSL